MKSDHYDLFVAAGKEFQKNNKTWNGGSTPEYAPYIKELFDKDQCESLLDYGCGKALHYEKNSVFNFGTEENHLTFDEYLGAKTVFKYDPCVDHYSTLPPEGTKFDAVILIQCVGLIPDADIQWVKNLVMNYATKFVFIGEKAYGTNVKSKKIMLPDQQQYKSETRDSGWWDTKWRDGWTGPELVIHLSNKQ
jgi:hypothetical protein